MDALLAGVYDGNLTFSELKTKGDFGIGGFNHLDGELLINEGKVYRIRYNGRVQEVADADSTSIAFVKFFNPDTSFTISGRTATFEQVQQQLSRQLNANGMYAIRLKGAFTSMHTRAPEPAKKPYPPLDQHLKTKQHDFRLVNTSGVCVGFLLPAYAGRTNVPGYHFHYLADDHQSGGHVFDFTTNQLTVEVDYVKGFSVEMNTNPAFGKADLQKNRQEELEKVE